MSDMPQTEPATTGYQPPDEGGGFINFVQQPRILLMLLAGWAIVGFLTELFTSNALFLENHGTGELALDGVLAGRALGWEGIPLAVLYLYCARDPQRFAARRQNFQMWTLCQKMMCQLRARFNQMFAIIQHQQ